MLRSDLLDQLHAAMKSGGTDVMIAVRRGDLIYVNGFSAFEIMDAKVDVLRLKFDEMWAFIGDGEEQSLHKIRIKRGGNDGAMEHD